MTEGTESVRPIRAATPRPRAPARRLRGLPWNRVEFAALDFEATGLDFETDSIVSYGLVPVRAGRALMSEAVYQEVHPDVAPSHRSIAIHELRAADLADAPTVEAVREPLSSALQGRFLLTWSAGVEIGFLSGLYGGSHRWWRRRTVDVLRLAVALERVDGAGPGGDYQLASVAGRYGVPVESPHHALGDALMTAELFMVMATKLAGHGYSTVRRLLRETEPRPPGPGPRYT